MSEREQQEEKRAGAVRYRLVVEGELDEARAGWFGAVSLLAADGLTTMELDVADQAELHGIMRRVSDVNLRVVELARLPAGAGDGRGIEQTTSTGD